jgi:hypothetical protein
MRQCSGMSLERVVVRFGRMMRGLRGLGVSAAAVSVALTVCACGSSTPAIASSLPGLTASKLPELKAQVLAETTAAGDAHPSSVTVFATRWHEAAIAAGAGPRVGSTRPVYLVVARGHFDCRGCGGGQTEATGDVFTVVLDRKTLLRLPMASSVGGNVNTSGIGQSLPLNLGSAP